MLVKSERGSATYNIEMESDFIIVIIVIQNLGKPERSISLKYPEVSTVFLHQTVFLTSLVSVPTKDIHILACVCSYQ